MRRFLLVAAACTCSTACLTTYVPKQSARIAVTDAVGVRNFAKDGALHPDGFLGDGLYELVRSDPVAADQAAAHRTDIFWADVVGGAAVASAATGTTLLAVDAKALLVPGVSLLGGAALAAIPVAILELTADTHMWNAINRYNDDIAP